jgi:type IV pilus assembly protein PilX
MRQQFNGQSGVVLLVSLIVLLLLTIIGVTAVQNATLDEKMAGNIHNHNLAFQAAESALLAGELYLSNTASPQFNCSNGLFKLHDANCDGNPETVDIWEDATIWSAAAQPVKYNTDGGKSTLDLAQLSANPRYIIEEMPTICTTAVAPCPMANQQKTYRITSRAAGGSAGAVVMLQSVFSPS